MSEAVTCDAGPGTAPEVSLAECWAEFTKAIAIYPDTNTRVRAKLDTLLEMIASFIARARAAGRMDAERGVSILLRENAVIVEGDEHPYAEGSVLAWLDARIHHAGLAGIELLADVDRSSMIAFSRRLLANYLRKEPAIGFEELWPETYQGIVLIDRRFEGTFGGVASEGPFAGGRAGSLSASHGEDFVRNLIAHPKVARRLQRLSELGPGGPGDGETRKASELLRKVLEELPADDLRSRDSLIAAVCRVMDGLQERAAAPALGTSEVLDGEQFAQLLHQVSRQHFGRQGPDVERLSVDEDTESGPGGGRARDAGITDDVGRLLSELHALPTRLERGLTAEGEHVTAEQLTVLLHYVVNLERPHELGGLLPALQRLLSNPGAAVFGVLRAYLAAEDVDETTSRRRRKAVVEALARAGHAYLARACGALGQEQVLEDFPRGFGVYLQALDLSLQADREELSMVCEHLGPEPLLEPDRDLVAQVRALEGGQVAEVFQRPDARRLPLAHLLLAHHPEAPLLEAAVYLRALDLPEDEAFLLLHVQDLELLTGTYLTGLIARHLGRISSPALNGPISEVLCRHINGAWDDPKDRARLDSIRYLARYPCARSYAQLRQLARTWFGPFGGSEPAVVRRLARTAARDCQAA